MEEIWKDIKGYEGIYQISNFGQIKSLNYNHTGKEKIRQLDVSNKGYYTILLSKNGNKKKFSVHRLVAETFIPNIKELPMVNHIDGIKTNNNIDNLEWCDGSKNEKHAYDNGLKTKKFGENNPMAKSVDVFDLDGNFIMTFPTVKEAAKQMKVGENTVINGCKEKTKNPKTYIFRYSEKKEE